MKNFYLLQRNALAKKIVLVASCIFFANAQAQTVDAANCGTVIMWAGTTAYSMPFYAPFSTATKCGYATNQGTTNAPSLIYDTASSKWLLRYSSSQITGWSSSVNTGILAPNTTVGNWTRVFTAITDLTGTLGGTVLATDEFAKTNNQTYHPNPTTGIVTLKNSDNKTITQVQVYNIEGKLVQTQTPNTNEVKVDLLGFAKGIYTVQATLDCGSVVTQKIIKE